MTVTVVRGRLGVSARPLAMYTNKPGGALYLALADAARLGDFVLSQIVHLYRRGAVLLAQSPEPIAVAAAPHRRAAVLRRRASDTTAFHRSNRP